MQSRLTPRVFRAILENRPYGHSRCPRQLARLSSPGTNHRCYPQPTQRRCLFSFPPMFSGTRVDPVEKSSRAMKEMVTFMRAREQRTRFPPAYVLATAYINFVTARLEQPDVITRTHVRHLLQTFRYLVHGIEIKSIKPPQKMYDVSGVESLEATLAMLAQCRWNEYARPLVENLATRAYDRLCLNDEFGDSRFESQCRSALVSYVDVLSSSGQVDRALDTIKTHWDPFILSAGVHPWICVFQGLANEGRNEDIPKVVAGIQGLGFTFNHTSHQAIVLALADGDYMEATKILYESDVLGGLRPTFEATIAAVEAAARNSMLEWATEIMAPLQKSLSPGAVDATLVLAAAGGKDENHVHEILKEMIASNPEIQSSLSIITVNKLMHTAKALQRYDSVGQYAKLASKWGLQPDNNTYSLLTDSRRQAGDIAGALDLFRKFGSEMDAPLLNRLVVLVCNADQNEIDFDTITTLVGRLVDLEGRFDAESLTALCRALLYRHELESVSDFLRPRIDSYDDEHLALIRTAFVDYICDTNEPTENVWEAYELFNVAFPTAPRAVRLDIMDYFFKLGRTDLACLVFGHMRQKASLKKRPHRSIYARCFYGVGNSPDPRSLHLVHNMLKLDTEIEQDTDLLNALMYAYARCGMPEEAMDFFRQILHSEEGPTKDTLVIFFRVCEFHIDGVQEATKMMDKLKALEIEVDSAIYNAYVCALGAHCAVERAAEAISAMEARAGSPPTSLTIGSFYNSIPLQHFRDEAKQWAEGAYPELWRELEENIGWKAHEDRLFDIDRSMNLSINGPFQDTSRYRQNGPDSDV